MKATLRIPTDGGYKDIEVDITEEELAKLAEPQKTNKPTGYERAEKDVTYYYIESSGNVFWLREACDECDDAYYDSANYYSSKEIAENNARVDKLMRQLRRFAVEYRESDINWKDSGHSKWSIGFDYNRNELYTYDKLCSRVFGVTYFDSQEAANSAATAFHDELIWYFTEYKDSL